MIVALRLPPFVWCRDYFSLTASPQRGHIARRETAPCPTIVLRPSRWGSCCFPRHASSRRRKFIDQLREEEACGERQHCPRAVQVSCPGGRPSSYRRSRVSQQRGSAPGGEVQQHRGVGILSLSWERGNGRQRASYHGGRCGHGAVARRTVNMCTQEDPGSPGGQAAPLLGGHARHSLRPERERLRHIVASVATRFSQQFTRAESSGGCAAVGEAPSSPFSLTRGLPMPAPSW